jgi:hypothetical protein
VKRYIYIIIAIIVLAAIAIAILLLIKNKAAMNGGTGATMSTGGSLPVVGTQGSGGTGGGGSGASLSLPSGSNTGTGAGGSAAAPSFGVLSNNPVADYAVNASNTVIAIEPTGEVFTVVSGQSSIINTSTTGDIIAARFSYDGEKALVNFGDPNNPQTSLYDLASNTWTPLPQGMQSPVWSPAGYQIAFFASAGGGRIALQTIDASTAASLKKSPITLLTLNAADLDLQWPIKNDLVLSDKPSSENAGSIWLFDISAGTLSAVADNEPGLEGTWSGDAAAPYGLLFFNSQGQGSTLQLQALSGSAPTEELSFSTLPTKCAFSVQAEPGAAAQAQTATASSTGKTSSSIPAATAVTSTSYLALFCGVPRSSSGFSSARLPDDYNTMALFTSDDLYEVNTATGDIQSLWSDQTQNMDVSDVKIFNGVLFFVNRYDQKLYGLTLSQ